MKKKAARKQPFPVENVRRYLEPGPIVLVSSFWKGRRNVILRCQAEVIELDWRQP